MISIGDYIDGEKFEKIADFSFGDKYTYQKPLYPKILYNFLKSFEKTKLPIIYVDSDRVREFFSIIQDYNDSQFILLSHNGDTTFNEIDVSNKPKCIVKWFGQNINFKNNEFIISLPIGLERPHWSLTRYGENGYKHKKVYEYSKINFKKNKLCYLNFNPDTNKNKRNQVLSYFRDKTFCNIRLGGINGNLDSYFKECRESHFVLCPDGNGMDCHRNWEMLYLGVIPIIEQSPFHSEIYGDLPVLIVDSFENVDENYLNQRIDDGTKSFNYEKLKFSFWNKLIKN
jgi:hypothetical protein